MKLGVLFSGGKDSTFSMFRMSLEHEICCLITVLVENEESYMFQSLGNEFVKIQAEALGLPLVEQKSKGVKEEELVDLRDVIVKAKDKFGLDGIVTGALKSVYQGARIQKICDELGLVCFNPLWQTDERQYLKDLVDEGFVVKILGVFSYPLTREYVGRIVDEKFAKELMDLSEKHGISPVGEGGEFESFVLNSPLHKKRLEVVDSELVCEGENSCYMKLKKIELREK